MGNIQLPPLPQEVIYFDVTYPLLLELRQWLGDLVLMKIKSHTGCLLDKRADEYAELGRSAEGPELCSGPQKHGSFAAKTPVTTSRFSGVPPMNGRRPDVV